MVQTYTGKQIAKYLSKELQANISLDYIYFKPNSSLELINFKWQDKNNKTVFAVQSLVAELSLQKILQNKISIQSLEVNKGHLHIEVYQDSTNLSTALEYFSTAQNKDKIQKSKKIELTLHKILFKNNSIEIINQHNQYNTTGINFSDLHIHSMSGQLEDIRLDSIIQANISNFTLVEKSGFTIRELNTKASYTPTKMEFKELFLATNESIIQDYVKFEYEAIDDFNDFVKKVRTTAKLKESKVSSQDITYFAPSLATTIFNTEIEHAELQGTVNTFTANEVILRSSEETEIRGNIKITGLSQINSTIFDLNLNTLNTTPEDIEKIVSPLANNPKFKLPEQIHNMGKLAFKGTFIGNYHNFIVDGHLNTELGTLVTSSKINIKNAFRYTGQIKSPDFSISKLIDSDFLISQTKLDFKFDGRGLQTDNLTLSFQGNLSNTAIHNYNYENIHLNGQIANKELQLSGQVDDENLDVNFNSTIDWKNETAEYQLNANIKHAILQNLQWYTKDSITIHQANIRTNLTGTSINKLIGSFHADAIKLSSSKGHFDITYIDFTAAGDEQNRSLLLNSDIIDAQVTGNIDLYTIIPYFKSLAMRYAPASAIDTPPYNSQNFNLAFKIKSFKPIATLIDPNLNLADGTTLKANFSSDNYTANFTAYSPNIIYKGIQINNIRVHEKADDKAFILNLTADKISLSDSIYLQKIAINNTLANDSLKFTVQVAEATASNHLNLNGNIHFAPNAPAYIKLLESSIIFNSESWDLNKDAQLHISKGKIYVRNLALKQNKQQINLNGIISNENDELNIHFNRFSLTSLHALTHPIGINLSGNLNGNIQVTSVLRQPFITADINTNPITYNNIPIGQLAFNVDFNPSSGIANLDFKLLDEIKRGFTFAGYYNFLDKEKPLNIQGKLNDASAHIFQPFLRSIVSDLQGKIQADIGIVGSFKNPVISGTSQVKSINFFIDYLKVPFSINNQLVMVDKNSVHIQDLTLMDSNSRLSKANGTINLNNINNPLIDINIQTDNTLILNTSIKDNNIYYGKAFVSGSVSFKGYTNALEISINASSEPGTTINLPFNSASTISESDFIYFVSHDSSKNEALSQKKFFNGISMNMDLNLTPDATVIIQTNLGTLKGNGQGNIAMKISSLGDFEMFGDYVVNEGNFHFTAQDYFNKFFDIKEGGTIRWTGKPSEASINLNALYQQRTSVQSLYNAAGHTGGDNERVLAQADMLIQGTLAQPDISFDINFPQNPYIKDQLQSYLSDINNVNQQALSLIVRRGFTPSSTEDIGREVNSTLLSAGAEIAFNQINNIISQSLNINFFDINFRSFNDATASLRLWDDRLVFTGGITDRTSIQTSDLTFFGDGITTDAELTYKLRRDGNFMLRAYNRPYTRNFLIRVNDSEYISAFGLVYRKEFNSFTDFWKRFWLKKNKESKPLP